MVLTNGAIPKAALLAHVLQSRQHDIWTYRTASSWTGGDGMARLPVPSEKNEQGPPPGPSMSISLEIASHRRCQCPAAGSDHLLAGEAGGRQCRSAKEPPERVIEFWPARRLTSGRRVATKAGRYAPKRMRGERSHVGQQGQNTHADADADATLEMVVRQFRGEREMRGRCRVELAKKTKRLKKLWVVDNGSREEDWRAGESWRAGELEDSLEGGTGGTLEGSSVVPSCPAAQLCLGNQSRASFPQFGPTPTNIIPSNPTASVVVWLLIKCIHLGTFLPEQTPTR
ncbi:hypothetical protein B0J11DRAFT_508885 [Dendryphion nanum]|uniref:Uncharacterized protein n=1 Tax=Dendryphion nanum TaxID=256645 RepID=A0A9P9IG61_9PLEO|nr:hypothetical protein B0J11DRAFT_508885 [Dendryphion nanum]